jgi:homocysteine S-methyltransferase
MSANPSNQEGFLSVLARREFCLTEGALIERIRRESSLPLDPQVANAALLYSAEGRALLLRLWREYLEIGRAHELGIVVGTPTWRANPERLAAAKLPPVAQVASDAVALLAGLRASYGGYGRKVYLAGLMGCRGDAYAPQESLDAAAAESFHQPQAEALALAGVDFLLAATLPACGEALGMARAMAGTAKPYILSFVLRPDGTLLDGTPVAEAIDRIDRSAAPAPAAYFANCVHPSNCLRALAAAEAMRPGTCRRLAGLQGNASAKTPEELDDSSTLEADEPEPFAAAMLELRRRFGTHILGGCCGTNAAHIAAIASRCAG